MSQNEQYFVLGDLNLAVVRRKGRRHLAIEITPHGAIIRAPLRLALYHIQSFVKQKENWIRQQLALLPNRVKVEDGMICQVNGEAVNLVLCSSDSHSGIVNDTLKLPVQLSKADDEAYLRSKLVTWLSATCHQQLGDLVAAHKPSLEAFNRDIKQSDSRLSIRVRDYKKRWGSCDANGGLRFNWRLVQAPLDIQRYVVCHELAHLIEFNHSRRFWHIVNALCPDWQRSKQWLNTYGAELYRW